MSGFDMYLIMKLDNIVGLLTGIGFLGGLFGMIPLGIAWACYHEDDVKLRVPILVTIAWLFCLLCGLAGTLTPTTKEASVLYIAPKVINSEFVNEDLPEEAKELYGLAKQYLKDQVEKEQK